MKGTAQEGLHSTKTNHILAMVITLDLSKAYDNLFSLYLRLLLIHIGFTLPIVNQIKGCVTIANYVVLISGSATRFFKPSRGLRQGCPLYPYLFLLVVEGINQLINEEKIQRFIQGIRVGGTKSLPHSLFVNDVLLFYMGFMVEGKNYRDILHLYRMETSMEINIHKSTLVFHELIEELVQNLQVMFPFRIENLQT
jgi:hypothetical protein